MYKVKNEHFDIVSGLDYLIKPDVCPDWATSMEALSSSPEKELIIFTHLKVFQGKFADRGDALFLEISYNVRFNYEMLNVLQNHSYPDYRGIRLNYGTPSENIRGAADTFRSIDFKGFLKADFHCEAVSTLIYKSTLFLVFSDVFLEIDNS